MLVKRSGLRFLSLRLRPGALVDDADDLLADQAMTYAESRSRFARRRWPVLRKSRHRVRLNEHLEHPEGAVVFQHAFKMGLEGIVSKRLGSRYRSGRSPDWLKFLPSAGALLSRENAI